MVLCVSFWYKWILEKPNWLDISKFKQAEFRFFQEFSVKCLLRLVSSICRKQRNRFDRFFSSFPQFWCSPSNILCSLPSSENWKIKKETLFNDGDKTSLMQLVGIYNCNLHRNFELAKTVAIESSLCKFDELDS